MLTLWGLLSSTFTFLYIIIVKLIFYCKCILHLGVVLLSVCFCPGLPPNSWRQLGATSQPERLDYWFGSRRISRFLQGTWWSLPSAFRKKYFTQSRSRFDRGNTRWQSFCWPCPGACSTFCFHRTNCHPKNHWGKEPPDCFI